MEELNFEKSLQELESIVNKLEQGDVELDKAYDLFQKGVELVKNCEKKLKDVEGKVNKIIEENKVSELRIEDNNG